jgi:hypothetical protein
MVEQEGEARTRDKVRPRLGCTAELLCILLPESLATHVVLTLPCRGRECSVIVRLD